MLKTIIRKLERKKKKEKNPKAWKASTFCFFVFFFPLNWKGLHKTLKLNWKGFGLGLIVEPNK